MSGAIALDAIAPSVDAIAAAWVAHVEAEQRRAVAGKRMHLYASQRRECVRRSVLEATMPEALPEFTPDARARMMRGSQRERDIVIDLMRVGRQAEPQFDVIGTQERVEIRDRRGRIIITGKIDGRLKWPTSRESWPFEVKAWSPQLTERIHRFEDLYENRWLWSGAHQLLSYLYATEQPRGLLILDRPGLPRLIQVDLERNLEHMEGFLRDATLAVDHMEAGTLPDFHNDPAECKICPFYGHTCNPPLMHDGLGIITDPDFVLELEQREELRQGAEEFDRIDTRVKARLRGVESAIAGPFVIAGKWQKLTRYEIPEAIKAQFRTVDPKGKFVLSIEKVGA